MVGTVRCGKTLEVLERWGVLKDKIFKAKYKDKLEFPEGLGGGGQTKNKIGLKG